LKEYFVHIYLYELEKYLHTQKDEILKMSLWQDEANTDRPLKEYFKKLIENHFNKIPSDTDMVGVVIDKSEMVEVACLKNAEIKRVLLPEDINLQLKELLRCGKSGVYTNPDICLEIHLNGKLYYEPIELKTTKTDSIPGSSIQQVSPDKWVIFIKFSKDSVDIATGRYINAINSKMQFPDRSPRPQVSFSEARKWNVTNRLKNGNILEFKRDDDNLLKYELLSDWQGVLSKRWVDILINAKTTKANEPWFNNALRKFILDFLDAYETLDDKDKMDLKDKIKSLIVY